MGKKIDWLQAWKIILALCLTAIGELAIIDLSNLPVTFHWFYLFTGIGLLIGSFIIVQLLWEPLAQIITRKRKAFYFRNSAPQIEYSFMQKEDKVYLRLKSSPKNEKLTLRLDFWTPEPRWLINEDERYAIQVKFVNVNRKLMYINQEVLSDALLEFQEPVARIGDNYIALIACGWDIPIPLGKYIYQFQEQVVHKGHSFSKMRKFLIEVEKGRIKYEETE